MFASGQSSTYQQLAELTFFKLTSWYRYLGYGNKILPKIPFSPDTPRPQQHEARDKVFHSIWNLSFIPHNFKERFIKFLKNQLLFNDQLTKDNLSLINMKEVNKIKLLVAREIIILIRDRISDHLYVQTSYSCLGLIIYFTGMLNLTKKKISNFI